MTKRVLPILLAIAAFPSPLRGDELERYSVLIAAEADSLAGPDNLISFRVYLDGDFLMYLAPGGEKQVEKVLTKGAHIFRLVHGPSFGLPDSKREVEVVSNDRIQIKVSRTNGNNHTWTARVVTKSGRLITYKLDDLVVETVIRRSEPYSVPAGTTKRIEDTIETSEAVTVSNGSTLESNTGIKTAVFAAGIANGLTDQVSRTTSRAEKRARSVTITGDGSSKYCAVWVKQCKRGVADVEIDGKVVSNVPFEVVIDYDLRLERVE